MSQTGNDNNSGLSKIKPWLTISKLNSTILYPGDSVLFKGGDTLSGMIYMPPGDSGTPTKPIVFTNYGTGRAWIKAGTGTGFYAYNTSGFEIRNLNFFGYGSTNTGDGISIYTDTNNGHKFKHLVIQSVDISGFGDCGIAIGSYNSSYPGFSDVSISYVNVHDNYKKGIFTYDFAGASPIKYGHKNFYIGYCNVERNGIEGIVLSGVDSGLVEYCRSSYTGYGTNAGDAGIWAYESRKLVIQYCISDHIITTGSDGEGFDLDGGTQDCVIQYCYAYQNASCGFMHCDYPGSRPNKRNVIRYSISENDGRKATDDQASFMFISWGSGLDSCYMNNNTAYISDNGTHPVSAFKGYILTGYAGNPTINHCMAANNIMYVYGNNKNAMVTLSGSPSLWVDSNIYFFNNCYYAPLSNSLHWTNNSKNYTSLKSWQDSTGQEIYSGNRKGYTINPSLQNPGNGGALFYPDSIYTLSAYKLKPKSSLIGRGINISQIFPVNPAPLDFFSDTLNPFHVYTIGAHEPQPDKFPVAHFTFQKTCFGDSTNFYDSSKNAVSYFWDFGDNQNDTLINPIHKYKKTGTYTVKLTVKSIYGKSDSIKKIVRIFENPIAGFNAGSVCMGNTTRFNDTSHNAVSWIWDFGDKAAVGKSLSILENPTYKYSKSGSYQVGLTVKSQYGCNDSIRKLISVFQLPKAGFYISGNCTKNPFQFKDSSLKANTRIWDFGDSSLSYETNPSHQFHNSRNYLVTLKVFSSNGCADSMTKSILPLPSPKADFSFNDGCQMDSIAFSNLSIGATDYFWDFGDHEQSIINNPKHKFVETGIYSVKLRSNTLFKCNDTLSQQIRIYPLPNPKWGYIYKGKAVDFTAKDSVYNRYYWDFGDNTADSSSFIVSHFYKHTGKFLVNLNVVSGYNCKAFFKDSIIVENTGIQWNTNNKIQIRVYPNPITNAGFIEFKLPLPEPVSISLINEKGQLIYSLSEIYEPTGIYRIAFPGLQSEIKQGTYILIIHTKTTIYRYKILKI